MKRCIDMRLEVTEKEKGEMALPRVVRLARKYKFSTNETMSFYYVLVDMYGLCHETSKERRMLRTHYGLQNMSEDLSWVCSVINMPVHEMLDFLSSERQHMQHGLFPDINLHYGVQNALRLDGETMKVLSGGRLSSSEYLKVENTPLGEILSEEPGSEHYTKALLEPTGECLH